MRTRGRVESEPGDRLRLPGPRAVTPRSPVTAAGAARLPGSVEGRGARTPTEARGTRSASDPRGSALYVVTPAHGGPGIGPFSRAIADRIAARKGRAVKVVKWA